MCRGTVVLIGLIAIGCAGLVGCDGGVDEFQPFDAFMPPPDEGDDVCAAGCNVLLNCGFCEVDAQGNCLLPSECAATCRDRCERTTYECLAALGPVPARSSCPLIQIDGCYARGFQAEEALDAEAAGNDGCAAGCNALLACGEYVFDDDGRCLPATRCAEMCRADGAEAEWQCVSESQACGGDAVDACFEPPLPPPVDGCEAGCRSLDDCGLCATDDAGVCLSVEACTAACRETGDDVRYQCYAEVEACDDAQVGVCADLPEPMPEPDPPPAPEPDSPPEPEPDPPPAPEPDPPPEPDPDPPPEPDPDPPPEPEPDPPPEPDPDPLPEPEPDPPPEPEPDPPPEPEPDPPPEPEPDPPPEPEPDPPPPPAACVDACAAAAACMPCLPGGGPEGCLAPGECAAVCVGAADTARCAVELATCDGDALAVSCAGA